MFHRCQHHSNCSIASRQERTGRFVSRVFHSILSRSFGILFVSVVWIAVRIRILDNASACLSGDEPPCGGSAVRALRSKFPHACCALGASASPVNPSLLFQRQLSSCLLQPAGQHKCGPGIARIPTPGEGRTAHIYRLLPDLADVNTALPDRPAALWLDAGSPTSEHFPSFLSAHVWG